MRSAIVRQWCSAALWAVCLLSVSASAEAITTAGSAQSATREQITQHLEVMAPLAAAFQNESIVLHLAEDGNPEKELQLFWQQGLFRQERHWLGGVEAYGFDGDQYWFGSDEMLPFCVDYANPADVSHVWLSCLHYCAAYQQEFLRPLSIRDVSEARRLPQLKGSLLCAWSPPQMSEAWLLLEPESLQLMGYLLGDQRLLDDSSVLRLTLFSGWENIDGTTYPPEAKVLTVTSRGEEVRERSWNCLAIERSVSLTSEHFEIASSPAVGRLDLAGPLVLPFELHDDDITLSATTSAGEVLRLKFDTGANIGLLRRDKALALGLQPSGSEPVTGHGNVADLQFVRVSGLRLGNVELPPYSAAVMLEPAGPQPGEPGYAYYQQRIAPNAAPGLDDLLREDGVDGLLGTSLLNNCVVCINYPARQLTLYSSKDFDANRDLGPGRLELPLRRHALPFTEVVVDKRLRGGAFFNTGARPFFNLSIWALDAHSMEYPIESLATAMSIHGPQVFGIIRPGVVELGSLLIERPYTFLESLAPGDEPEDSRLASFGSEFFHKHVVTFDLFGERLYVEPAN